MPPWIGPGPDDRHLDHQVVEAARLQPRQHAHLRARFDLEHADGVAAADHVVGGAIFGGDVLHAPRPAAMRGGEARAPCGSRSACRAPARRPSAGPASRGRPCPTGSRCDRASRRSRSAPAHAAARPRSRSRRRAATGGAGNRAARRPAARPAPPLAAAGGGAAWQRCPARARHRAARCACDR